MFERSTTAGVTYRKPGAVLFLGAVILALIPVATGTDLVLQGNNVTVMEGYHQLNRSIYVEENATLVLRNAVLNFSSTFSYQFETWLGNPEGGSPRLIVENSEIVTPGNYQHQIYFYHNSTGTIRGLETSEGVRIQGYHDSVIDISDSVVRGVVVYGRMNSRINVTNSTVVGLYGEGNTRVYARNCTIGNKVNVVIQSANVTIEDLHPGYVSYWNLTGNHSISHDPLDWNPTMVIEDSQVTGFGLHFSRAANVTIRNSDLRSIIATRDSRLHVEDSTTDFAFSTRDETEIEVHDCYFGSSSAQDNSTLTVTNCTFQNHWLNDRSSKTEYWYLRLTVVDPAGSPIPGAAVEITQPGAIIATEETNQDGEAVLTLLGGTTNATGYYSAGPYDIAASHLTYTNRTTIEMDGNRVQDIILPIPVPEPTIPIVLVVSLLLILKTGNRPRAGSEDPSMKDHGKG